MRWRICLSSNRWDLPSCMPLFGVWLTLGKRWSSRLLAPFHVLLRTFGACWSPGFESCFALDFRARCGVLQATTQRLRYHVPSATLPAFMRAVVLWWQRALAKLSRKL